MSADFLATLDPKTRKRLQMASEVTIEKQPMPSLGMTLGLEGGLGYGRMALLWGNKSAGKSSILQQMIADAQAKGKSCAWIDAEQSYDPAWAARLGVDNESLIHSPQKSISSLVDTAVDFCSHDLDILVIDSITALVPTTFYSDQDEFKSFDKMGAIGSDARDLSKAIKVISAANNNTLIVMISQQRNQIGAMYTSVGPTGGQAPQFYSSTVIKLWSSDSDAKAIKDKIPLGDKLVERSVGRRVNWTIEKNKLGPQSISGEYDFFYQGDYVGVDRVGEIVDFAESFGIISKGGAWYNVYGEALQGRRAAVEFLRENDEARQKVVEELEQV
jgi:recombination protein RecA